MIVETATVENTDLSNFFASLNLEKYRRPELTLHYSTVTKATDTNPVEQTASWDDFVTLFEHPEVKQRSITLNQYLAMPVDRKRRIKDGAAWLPALFDGKRKDENVTQLCAWAIDFDEGDQTEASLRDVIEAQAFMALGHTSFSHHPDKPKWRVIVPFKNPITPDKLPLITRYFFDLFGASSCDEKCTNPGRLFYLPSCLPDAEKYYQWFETGGDLFDVDAVLETYQPTVEAIEQEAIKAPLALHSTAKLVDGSRSPIDEFNAAHSVHEVLVSAGYRKIGKRYLSPFSESGMPGVTILKSDDGKECAYSHHGNDPLSDGKRHDAFDCFTLLTCAGDIKTALNWDPELTRHNQRVYMEQQARQAEDQRQRDGTAPDISEIIARRDRWDEQRQQSSHAKGDEQSQLFNLLSFDDLAALPPMEWRIKGIMPAQGIAAIYGASGSGKSFLSLDMAGAIACGREWFGYRVKQAPVVYICLEGEAGLKNRVAAYRTHQGGDSLRGVHFIVEQFDILNSSPQKLAETINQAGLVNPTIIIDTLNRAAPGADENSVVDMGKIINASKYLQAETNGLVVLVHHTGKDSSKGLRGHSSLHAALDAAIAVERISEGETIQWVASKVKDDVAGKKHPFSLKRYVLGEDSDGDEISSCAVEPDTSAGDVLTKNERHAYDTLVELYRLHEQTIAENGTHTKARVSKSEWADECGFGTTAASGKKILQTAKQALIRKGFIAQDAHFVWPLSQAVVGFIESIKQKTVQQAW